MKMHGGGIYFQLSQYLLLTLRWKIIFSWYSVYIFQICTNPVTSQPYYSLHLHQNGEKTLVWNLGMNSDVNSKHYL